MQEPISHGQTAFGFRPDPARRCEPSCGRESLTDSLVALLGRRSQPLGADSSPPYGSRTRSSVTGRPRETM